MASQDNTGTLAAFMSVTGCSESTGKNYLEATGWNLQLAMNTYFEGGASSASSHRPTRNESPETKPKHPPASGRPVLPDHSASNHSVEKIRTGLADKVHVSVPTKRDATVSKNVGKRSIISKAVKHDDDSDEETSTKFVGGSVRSGQLVVDPPKSQSNQERITKVFDAARQQGAHEVASSSDTQNQAARGRHQPADGAFSGSGHSLVEPEVKNDRKVAPVHAPPPVQKPREVPIRFYLNGFTVDGGELREYEDNELFLSYIRRSEIPPELKKLDTQGHGIEVRLENHKNEEYTKKEPTFEAFSGHGNAVGLPSSVGNGDARNPFITPIPETIDIGRLEKLAERRLKTSTSTTSIRLRLPEVATPMRINIDLDKTLGDIRRFIVENIVQLRSNAFEFLEPPSTKITVQEERQKIAETRFAHSNLVICRTGK